MKHLLFTLICLVNFSFAQKIDFFEKLDFKDLVFYGKEISFAMQITGNTEKSCKGNFKISSNTYEIENCTLSEQYKRYKPD